MSLLSKMDKQKLIDSLAYPPTHTYSLGGLEPEGVLKERVEVIKRIAPDFFTKSKRFSLRGSALPNIDLKSFDFLPFLERIASRRTLANCLPILAACSNWL